MAMVAVRVGEVRRSEATLREQRALIVQFLRDKPVVFDLDDAAATCSPGYAFGIEVGWNPKDRQPPGYDELVKWGKIRPPGDPYDVEPDAGPSPRESPRWEADIARVDGGQGRWAERWPLYVRLGVPAALGRLNPKDRELVRLIAEQYATFRDAADSVGLPTMTASDRYHRALDAVCRALWDDDGAPRWGNVA